MRINVFNKVWWALFIINFICLLSLRMYLADVEVNLRNSIVFYLSLGVCFYFIVYRTHILRKFEYKSYDFYNYLPFYPCNILTFVLPITIMFHNSYFEATTLLFGTTFPLLAVFMPTDDIKNLPLFSAEGSGFYITHYGMWTLSVVYASFVNPTNIFWVNRAVVVFLGIMLLEHSINIYFRKTGKYPRANFGFTCDRENNPIFEKLYSFIPYNFFYLLPLIPAFILIGVVINMILTL